MKTLVLLAVFLIAAPMCEAAPKWLRRVTLAAACAASAFDAHSTARGIRYGALESNSLMRTSDGRPAVGRLISLKAGMCATAAAAQEYIAPKSNVWIPVNLGSAFSYGWVAHKNYVLTEKLSALATLR